MVSGQLWHEAARHAASSVEPVILIFEFTIKTVSSMVVLHKLNFYILIKVS